MSDYKYVNCQNCSEPVYTSYGDVRKYCHKCQDAKTEEATALALSNKAKYETQAAELRLKELEITDRMLLKTVKARRKSLITAWLGAWFLIGACLAFYNRAEHLHGCVYRSIGSFINPGYLIGCEIFRERWEIGR